MDKEQRTMENKDEPRAKNARQGERWSFITLDPPYGFWLQIAFEYVNLPLHEWVAPGFLVRILFLRKYWSHIFSPELMIKVNLKTLLNKQGFTDLIFIFVISYQIHTADFIWANPIPLFMKLSIRTQGIMSMMKWTDIIQIIYYMVVIKLI